MRNTKKSAAIGLLAALSLAAAACGSDAKVATPATQPKPVVTEPADTVPAPVATDPAPEATDPAPEATDPAPEATDVPTEDVCPAKVVIQTDWWPELEHGGSYQLIGAGGKVDAANFNYSGPIQAQYAVGGVKEVEIRAGGDAISFAAVTSEMYTDTSITFGYVNMSDAMKDSGGATPVVGVAKTLEINPQMVMWDPAQLKIETPADMAASKASVLHFDGTAYMKFLEAEGFVTADQLDPSYGGAPDQWIANSGNFIQQGFATNEIYKYENDIQWKDGAAAPVDYFLIDELGFHDYPAMMSVRAGELDAMAPCLKVLVPMLQQAWVDFLADPTPITDELIKINTGYDTYWTLSEGLNTKGLEIVEERGIAANSADGTYCSMDEARVQEMADILGPIYTAEDVKLADDLTAVVDNQFCEGAPGR
jgi:hypothetical protein